MADMRCRILLPAVLLLAFSQAAFAQTQLIQDGGFESQIIAPWQLAGSGIAIASGVNANGGYAYDGAQYLSMGNFSGAVQYAYQTVTFPTNLIAATLSLYYQTVSTDPNGDDDLYFYIMGTNNSPRVLLAYTDSAYQTSGYVNYTTNFSAYAGPNTLSSYAGQTVEVYFYVTTDSSYGSLTSFDIDDVSLLVGTTADIPANDHFTNATPILTTSLTDSIYTAYASKDPGEPDHAGNVGGHSVWWTWTAPAIGTVNINTTGSGFDTLLAVYTSSSPANPAFSNLTCVSSNNGATRSTGLASLTFTVPTVAQVGAQYYIALDGYNGQSGNAVFNFTFTQDTTPPSVSISSPAAGVPVTNAPVLVQGTATDNVAVAFVQCQLSNAAGAGPWQPAATTNAWTNWTATFTNLIPGTNTVTVEAFDTSSNISLVSRVFRYDVPAPLTLSTNGRGTITIAGATNGQWLDLGFPYTLTAKAAAGFAFAGWTGSIASANPSLTFIMATNLSFTANFVQVQKPILTVTAPTSGQRWSNSLFQIAGKASDLVAVASVFYQFDGGGWTLATTTNAWTNWTANVTLTQGLNTVRAYAVDTGGILSTNTNSISFYYILTAPLVVQTNGRGTISHDYNNNLLAIGSNYSMTATAVPGSGFAFTNWTGGTNQPFGVLTNKAKLTFTMESNLTLIADFVDVTPPGLTVTSPTASQRWSNSTFTAAGTAKDNVAVASVYYQLNSNGWTPAGTTNTNTWANWTATLTPLESTNVFAVYAVDTSGNKSPTNKVTFLYIPSATLTVLTNGFGGITPVDSGKLLAIGTNYTLNASPGKNWIFSNWVGGTALPYSVLSASSNYTFAMQSNLVLQANFVTNVFLAAQGTYNGLFAPTNAPRRQTNSGAITLTVTSTGVFSGKLTIGASAPTLTGQFNPAGAVTILTPRKGQSSLTTALQLDFANQALAGSVTDGGFVAQVVADLDVFSATNKATNYEGQYTFIIPGANDPAAGPMGTSCGTATVSALGAVSFSVSLADGTTSPVNPSSVVSKDGYWPFYLPLYGGNGSLWSWNCFTNGAMMSAAGGSWINATNSTKTALYRAGFTNEAASIFGSAYNPAAAPLLALTNGQVILQGGNLPFPIINQFILTPNNTVLLTNAADTNKLVLTITKTNGVISGAFANPGNPGQTINVNGVLLQNQANAQGYFPGTNASGAFLLAPQ
jgi:hypothetical protein